MKGVGVSYEAVVIVWGRESEGLCLEWYLWPRGG